MSDPKITDEQVFNCLPGPLADVAAELMNGCRALPLIIPVMAGLATIAAAIGPAVTLDSGVAGPRQASLQIFLGLNPDVIAAQVLDLIFAPLRLIQQELLKAHGGIIRKELQAKRRILELDKAHVPENDRSPDRRNIDNELTLLDRLERPLILLDGPGQMERSFRQSFDQSLLFLSTEPEKARALITHWCSKSGRSEIELIQNAQRQRPFINPLLHKAREPALAAPNLNMFLTCDSESLDNLVLGPELAAIRDSSSFIAVSVPNGPAANFVLAGPVDCKARWCSLINCLFELRQDGSHTIVEVTTEALARFYERANGLINEAAKMLDQFRPFARVWIGQHWPLALILHLCGPKPHGPMSLETAEKAITLARWLGEAQWDLRIRLTSRPEPQSEFIVQFIRENVGPGGSLTLTACYAAYRRHCERSTVQPFDQPEFKTVVQPVIRELYNRQMRNDLIGPKGITRGWRGITLLPSVVQSQAMAKYDLVIG